jgi:bifunctional oligoribonuclease and PAP phosphatase NrnA
VAADLAAIPVERREALAKVRDALLDARNIVLTTHVNADGDGAGSEAAMAAWLLRQGKHVRIANPTPYPELYGFLLENPKLLLNPGDPDWSAALNAADLFVVLDVSEPRRLGRVAGALRDKKIVLIDHHPPNEGAVQAIAAVQEPGACATGELIYDLFVVAGTLPPWPAAIVDALYAAIVTDTGSFRFANTTPRTHIIAADLLRRGVDPEEMYRRIFATVPLRRIHLLRAALEQLDIDPAAHLAWITVPRAVMDAANATSEDLEGLVEHARSIEGTEVAMLFRETADGSTKISLRSNGRVDVNAIARQFGGGGHIKASGALTSGPLEETRAKVLDAARAAVHALESSSAEP